MPEPLPTSVGTPTKRSGAIYNSADLFYKLIEEETLHAIKPYQDALQKLSCQLADARAARQAPDTRDTVTVTQANLIAQQVRDQAMNELDELKDTLTENGLGVTWASGRKTLRFHLLFAHLAVLDCGRARTMLTIGAKSLKETEDKYAAALKERDQLNRALTKRKDETQAEASRWGVQREHLSAKIVALTEEVESLRKEAQTFSIRMISVRVESDDWKEKYLAADVERASLQTRIDETEGNPS
ncbi:hypothetical protein B0H10DRAFT_320880 [Mycena sp. CBHHK59/15]|nr:hypothetical protein B0H10DRAFT_320880 [Mycena sp. CBHHK59/15]